MIESKSKSKIKYEKVLSFSWFEDEILYNNPIAIFRFFEATKYDLIRNYFKGNNYRN